MLIIQKQLDKAPKQLVEKWGRRPEKSCFKVGYYQRPPKQELNILGYYVCTACIGVHASDLNPPYSVKDTCVSRDEDEEVNSHMHASWL